MGLTIATIKQELERRKFPKILDEDDYQGIIDGCLREMNRYNPVRKIVSFTTVSDQQDYPIFDPEDTVTAGICASAQQIIEVYWNPGGDWSSLNIYSPGWQMLSQVILYTGSYFNQPSQMMVLRQKLDNWKKQFGSQGFDILGNIGDPTSVLRLYPVPKTNEAKVLVDFRSKNTLTDITSAYEDLFMQWAEHYTADTLANLYATTAGIDLLNFSDSTAAMKYWQGKADRYREKALDTQGGMQQGVVDRT